MDVLKGYNNVRIKDGDQWKAAFITNKGLFEPTVMFFGLCNSPATFQAMMNSIFSDLIAEGWIIIYMDDILIFSKDPETHQKRTKLVLQRLSDHDLYLKREKCFFNVSEVEFLGTIIRKNTVQMDPSKLTAIHDWPVPKTLRQLQQFLGLGNYYRRFITHYSDIIQPLYLLTQKDVPWHWNKEQQSAFDKLKNSFTSAPVLAIPNPNRPFRIESDASKFASGGVLSQEGGDGLHHPCAFLSKSFNAAERNYEIYDRELLAIIRCLAEWKHYLEGSGHPVEIWSDHLNLTYFKQPQRLTPRQARWSLYLSQFDFVLKHVPGKLLGRADALSQRVDLNPGESEDKTQTLLPTHLFVAALAFEPHIDKDIR